MKKIIAILIILCLCLFVISCKTKSGDNEIAQPNNDASASDTSDSSSEDTQIVQQVQGDAPQQTMQATENEPPSKEEAKEDTPASKTQHSDKQEEDVFIIQGETSIETAPPLEVDLRLACVLGTDMFTAKVIKVTPLPKDTKFFSLDTPGAVPVLYTVEVQNVYKDFIVTPKSTIQVVDYMIENGTDDNWDNALEIDKTYLFGGWAEPYGKKPIIVCHGLHSAQIKEDGALEYCSSNAEISLKGINTLKDIITNETVSDIIYSKTDSVLLYESFYELTNVPSDNQQEQPTFEQVISELKEAIKIDSDKVLKTPKTVE